MKAFFLVLGIVLSLILTHYIYQRLISEMEGYNKYLYQRLNDTVAYMTYYPFGYEATHAIRGFIASSYYWFFHIIRAIEKGEDEIAPLTLTLYAFDNSERNLNYSMLSLASTFFVYFHYLFGYYPNEVLDKGNFFTLIPNQGMYDYLQSAIKEGDSHLDELIMKPTQITVALIVAFEDKLYEVNKYLAETEISRGFQANIEGAGVVSVRKLVA